MSQSLLLQINGLNTNSNQLSKVAPGALTIAKNLVIDKDGVGEPRRGMDYYPNSPTPDTIRHDRLFEFQGHLIAHRISDNTLAYYDSGWTQYNSGATFANPDDDYARMRFLKAAGNCYFTTSVGVRVIDTYNGTVYATGMPKGLDGSGATTGASGFMANNTQVAYRIVWGSKDANNNLYLGAPSQRIIVPNISGGTRDVALTFTIPAGITVNDFFQVYRSKESASSTDEPNDELQLVYEANPSAGQISAKSVTYTDSTPVSLMGAFLYTNSSQEGPAETNDAPPVATDLAFFKGFTFYSNTRTTHKLFISLISVGGTGLVNGDTITINSIVFTGQSTENAATAQFKITTSGSAAQNIADTAQSLVKVINQYAANTSIYAYYMSGYDELPGQILLEKRTIDQVSFTVTTSRAAAFNLDDGVSDNEEYINGLAWSKDNQAEHVPASHLQRVGSNNFPIRRILALRDSLFILKDDGVFRVTGASGTWTIAPLDTSTKIIAPDSAIVVNNQIYCLSDQGIVAISDLGVEIKSIPIEDQIKELISIDYDKLKTLSYGISYETDRKFILFTIGAASDTYPTQAFVFNTITSKWTTWNKGLVHGFVNPDDDKLYFAQGGTHHIFQERKTFTANDFCDESLSGYNIVSYSDLVVELDSIDDIEIGDVLYESAANYSIITEIDAVLSTVTVSNLKTWTVGAVTIIKAIDCELEFTNITNDNPGVMKIYQEVAWLFREKNFATGTTSFYTDLSGGYDDTTITGDYGTGSWGGFPWGTIPWGGVLRPKPIRVFVMREKSRGSLLSVRLKIKNAFAAWAMNGLSVQFEYVSERMTRE